MRAASPNGMQQNMYTAVTAWPTAAGSVAPPSPAIFATTPPIAAPNAVPIERTEVRAEAVAAMFVGGHAVHGAGDEVHVVEADADPHHKGAQASSARVLAAKPRRSDRRARSWRVTGPDIRAKRSRFPDHPETVKVRGSPSQRDDDAQEVDHQSATPRCTTCSNNGRNKVTEVCVIPCSARIHSASPIGALIDESAARKEIVGGPPVEPEGQADKRHRNRNQEDAELPTPAPIRWLRRTAHRRPTFRSGETARRRSGRDSASPLTRSGIFQ